MTREEEKMDPGESVPNFSFVDDLFSRRVMRFLLLLEIAAMFVVVVFSFKHLFLLALILSFLTLLFFVATLQWLYTRYKGLPVVREKRELERLSLKFQKRIQMEEQNIQAAIKGRADLFLAEKAENSTALRTLQKEYIEKGLMSASIQEAAIEGIGQKFKEGLAEYNIRSAADITEKISEVPGFGEAKGQALLDWRSCVLQNLESTQPENLPEKQDEAIQARYRALQDQNNAAHRRALTSRQMLQYELISFRERLKQLASFTFVRYVSRSLASRAMVAAPLALALVLTQVISSVSATASIAFSMLASVPAAQALQTSTSDPISTSTNAATPTLTATVLSTETTLPTLSPTLTLSPIATLTPLPSLTLQPSDTPIIPVSGGIAGNCDPSYPGVCIPPPPPDLDCGDISFKRFQVLPPDPHHVDRDGDGIGCES
jgi:hypothetical protein